MISKAIVTQLASVASVATCAAVSLAHAADTIAPNSNLKADGIPPIPAELAAKLDPHAEFKPAVAVD